MAMDVETTQALGTLGMRIDGLENHMIDGLAGVREEMRAESAKLRAEIASL